MSNQGHQIGVNPIPYNMDQFIEYDSSGKEITNSEIQYVQMIIRSTYATLPSYTIYPKEVIDRWVDTNSDGIDESVISEYTSNVHDFLCVVAVKSGFFKDHKILIHKVNTLSNSKMTVDYSVVDSEGVQMSSKDAMVLENVVNGVVALSIYEQTLFDLIETEKSKR